MTIDELLPNEQDRRLFTRREMDKMTSLLGGHSYLKSGLSRTLIWIMAAFVIFSVLFLRLGPARYPLIFAGVPFSSRFSIAFFGPIFALFFLALIFFYGRDFRIMKGQIESAAPAIENTYLRNCLLASKRFLLIVSILGILFESSLFLSIMTSLMARKMMVSFPSDPYSFFPLLWTIGALINLYGIAVLFSGAVNAGIILKLHVLKTGQDRIEI